MRVCYCNGHLSFFFCLNAEMRGFLKILRVVKEFALSNQSKRIGTQTSLNSCVRFVCPCIFVQSKCFGKLKRGLKKTY